MNTAVPVKHQTKNRLKKKPINGVAVYAVLRRTREIGIRVALGATRFQILRLVTGESLALIGLGTAIGLGIACALTRALSSWFSAFATMTETSISDPVLLIGAPLLLALLTIFSCYVPARRSLKIDPASTLRQE